jgi:hypothetical protein
MKIFLAFALVNILTFIGTAHGGLAGLAAYGLCQTGCNTGWCACVAAAGGVAGVSTGGAAIPAAILACNVLQGTCMAACAAMALSPV